MIRHKSGTQRSNDLLVGWCHVRSTLYRWRRREARVFWFSLKTGSDGLSVVLPQNNYDSFLVWASKLRLMVWWFRPQKHCADFLFWASKLRGGGFSVCASKLMSGWRWCEVMCQHPVACFITKQVRLGFHNFVPKLAVERWRMVHVASSRRSRGREAKDSRFDSIGCGAVEVRPSYPSVVVAFILPHMGILVFCFHI
jgi:hypothetical protein